MVTVRDRRIRLVLQARSSSARLPSKSLLDVRGLPLAILAAKRAARGGLDLVFATSSDSSDNRLASAAADAGLPVVRGSLEDVLERFVFAVAGLDGDDLCVRLTGDNPVPDSDFIHEVITLFESLTAPYFGVTGGPGTGLPYGLAVECFRIALLREAHAKANDAGSREHVTQWMRESTRFRVETGQRHAAKRFRLGQDLSDLSCTVDSAEDFWRITRLFAEVDDPIRVPWGELCLRLPNIAPPRVPLRAGTGRVHSNLIVGTAQFGAPYGIADGRQVPMQSVERIVRRAISAGVTDFDTARAYGESEARLGAVLDGERGIRLTTKLPGGLVAGDGAAPSSVHSAVSASVAASLAALRRDRIDTLMLHDPEDRTKHGGAVWQSLLNLKAEGVIGRLGISAYDPQTALAAAAEPEVAVIQHPLNLLDPRWRFLLRSGVATHVEWLARSILLQGLLTLFEPDRWTMTDRPRAADLITRLRRAKDQAHCSDITDLCFRFTLGHENVSAVVVGVATEEQLETNICLAREPALPPGDIVAIYDSFRDVPPSIYDPRTWSR